MKKILHVANIDASPEEIYAALTTQAGLSGWWTTEVTAATEVGGVIDFTFGATFNPDMEITALDPPRRVAWKCVGGHEPWQDNTFEFRIEDRDGATMLFFTQVYAQELGDEAYGIYNYNWGYYLESLRKLVESGTGTPYQAGRPDG